MWLRLIYEYNFTFICCIVAYFNRGRRDRMFVGLTVPITTNAVSSNPVHGEVYSIQHYVI